jgi:predicted KAP-like P-loop ATPase
MKNYFSMDELKRVIEQYIINEIEHIVKDAELEAKIQIERRIREITGKVAAKVFHQFNFSMNEQEMIINVNTKDLKL